MAITSTQVSRELVLVMDNGVSSTGKALTKNLTYSNVKLASADADLYSVADSLTGLQTKTRVSVKRLDTSEIINE
jgi:hypothetical protein